MEKTINKIIENDLREVPGTRLNINLPITQGVIHKMFLDVIDQDAFNWVSSHVGPDNVLLFKFNMTKRIIFKTSFTLAVYIKLEEEVVVSNSLIKIAQIYGVDNGLGFGMQKIMRTLRGLILENIPPYLGFQEDSFYINFEAYFKHYEILLSETFFSKLNLSTTYQENTSEEESARDNKVWLKTQLLVPNKI